MLSFNWRRIGFALVVVAGFFFAVKTDALAASIKLSPSSGSFTKSCLTSVNIEVDATGQSSNAADIEISYNPAQVTIVDSEPDIVGTQIKTGIAYEAYFFNEVNSGTGKIRIASGSYLRHLTSNKIFATIQFIPATSASSVQFNVKFDGVGVSLDSNIADSTTSNDLLSSVTNGSYSLSAGSCQSDTKGPQVEFKSPKNGQNIIGDSSVSIRLTDDQTGIDLGNTQFVIDGIIYKIGSSQVTYTGSALDYTFSINPDGSFSKSTPSSIAVVTQDVAGNTTSEQIFVNLPNGDSGEGDADVSPPLLTFITPVGFVKNYTSTEIKFAVKDTVSGVNLDSIKVEVNSHVFSKADSNLSFTGNALDYQFRLVLDSPLPPATYSIIKVTGKDLAGNPFGDYIVINMPSYVDPATCVPTDPTVSPDQEFTDGIISPAQCFAPDASLQSAGKVLGALLTDPTSDAFKNTFLENTAVERLAKDVGLTGLMAATAIPLAGLNLLSLFNLLNAPGLILNLVEVIFSRRKQKPWGVVYDSSTQMPVVFASCRLYRSGTNNLVEQMITDEQGRYGFLAEPGSYRLEIAQSGFVKYTKEYRVDAVDAPHFQDVELQPLSLVAASRLGGEIPFPLEQLRNFMRKLAPLLFATGFVLSIVSVAFVPKLFNILIFAVYLTIIFIYLYPSFRQKGAEHSEVIDSETKLRLPYVIIKVFDPKDNQLVDVRTSNSNGRFDFWVKPGEYILTASKPGYRMAERNLKVRLKQNLNNITIFMDPSQPSK